jgi:hypothetical protein
MTKRRFNQHVHEVARALWKARKAPLADAEYAQIKVVADSLARLSSREWAIVCLRESYLR